MKKNDVSYHQNLKVWKSNLVNQKKETVILKGISTHGIQWYYHLINSKTICYLKKEFKINALRIAMYTEENGYIQDKRLKEKVKEIINLCIALDLYVIIDWHILKDGNPKIHEKEAILFFDELSKDFKNTPNILYEICNEPNGDVTWDKDIKPYAEKIIKTIRKNGSNSIIIVGTENYSQGIDKIVNHMINEGNIMYSLHFYSGTHKNKLREKFLYAKRHNVPIIVSEFGVCDAQTNQNLDLKEAKKWLKLLKKYKISIFNWALSDKKEASSLLLRKETGKLDLSPSGKFIKRQYRNY